METEPSLVTIEKVWRKISPALQGEIIRFWEANQMLDSSVDAAERAASVVLLIRSKTDSTIVGISSAEHIQFRQLNNNYFFMFRSIILPAFRVPGLIQKIAVETRDHLEEYSATMTTNKSIGLLTFVENPTIITQLNEAVWPASKMVYIGSDSKGRHIRVYYFKGARI